MSCPVKNSRAMFSLRFPKLPRTSAHSISALWRLPASAFSPPAHAMPIPRSTMHRSQRHRPHSTHMGSHARRARMLASLRRDSDACARRQYVHATEARAQDYKTPLQMPVAPRPPATHPMHAATCPRQGKRPARGACEGRQASNCQDQRAHPPRTRATDDRNRR